MGKTVWSCHRLFSLHHCEDFSFPHNEKVTLYTLKLSIVFLKNVVSKYSVKCGCYFALIYMKGFVFCWKKKWAQMWSLYLWSGALSWELQQQQRVQAHTGFVIKHSMWLYLLRSFDYCQGVFVSFNSLVGFLTTMCFHLRSVQISFLMEWSLP